MSRRKRKSSSRRRRKGIEEVKDVDNCVFRGVEEEEEEEEINFSFSPATSLSLSLPHKHICIISLLISTPLNSKYSWFMPF